jgi:glycerate-2-kinase
MDEAEAAGIDVEAELRDHNSTLALLRLKSGIVATPNISLNDLSVILVMGRSESEMRLW